MDQSGFVISHAEILSGLRCFDGQKGIESISISKARLNLESKEFPLLSVYQYMCDYAEILEVFKRI